VGAGLMGDLNWLRGSLLATRQKGAAFAIRVAEMRGAETLSKPPQLIVGTIHAVKGGEADVTYLFPDLSFAGGEADVTYLFPDLSFAGMTASLRGAPSVRRLFYVGMTRSKESLVLCGAATGMAVRL